MLGIVLAGGLGTRLLPLTAHDNKHNLTIFDKPMIYYPLQTLLSSGVTDLICVVGEHFGDKVMKIINYGFHDKFNSIFYVVQKGEGGIAAALKLAEPIAKHEDNIIVCLGDNIYEDIFDFHEILSNENHRKGDAHIFVKEVNDPERFGVVSLDISGKPINIIEKPKNPESNLAVTGLYIYPNNVFDIIKKLKPSGRGELEITDVNQYYLLKNKLRIEKFENIWTDAGTFESLYYANTLMAKKSYHKKHSKKFEKVLEVVS
jgi:glucose-1-phosphate thymidylyltransferase